MSCRFAWLKLFSNQSEIDSADSLESNYQLIISENSIMENWDVRG